MPRTKGAKDKKPRKRTSYDARSRAARHADRLAKESAEAQKVAQEASVQAIVAARGLSAALDVPPLAPVDAHIEEGGVPQTPPMALDPAPPPLVMPPGIMGSGIPPSDPAPQASAEEGKAAEQPVEAPSSLPEASEIASAKAEMEQVARAIYEQFKKSPLLLGHYFFGHHFRLETPEFHPEIMQAAMQHRFLAVASPRESSKSTLLTFLYPAHGIIFQRFRFIVILQNTFTKAVMSLESIKKEIRGNEELRANFPGIEIEKDAEGDTEFVHTPTGFTTKVICKGLKELGSIRGVKFGAYRPDLIIPDDMEDDELVENPERRAKLRAEYDEALIPAGERGRCQYIVVGTVLHDDSQLAKLVSPHTYPEYHKLFYQAHLYPDQSGERSLWPEKWSVEFLRQLRREKPTVYAKEYQNDPVAGASARFRREDFRYWRRENNQYLLFDQESRLIGSGELLHCRPAISCDLAWSEKRTADAAVLMPGLLTPGSELLVDDYVHEKGLKPDQVAEYLFTMEDRLRALTGQTVPIGFEKAMLEQVTQWVLRNEMRARNQPLYTTDLVWDIDKEKRIQVRLQPRFAQHMIFFKHGMGDLEHQITRFPSGTHDDLADALQGLVQLLKSPRKLPDPTQADDAFMRMRQLAVDAKKPEEQRLYGITHPRFIRRSFPVIRSPL